MVFLLVSAKKTIEFFRKKFGKYYEIYVFLPCFVPDLTIEPKSRPMKQTVPISIILPIGIPNLARSVSASFADRSYTNKNFNFFQTILPLVAGASRLRPVYNFARPNYFTSPFREVYNLVPDGLNYNTTINVPEFANTSGSSGLIAGRQISFRTQPSKTSVELLSLTTGLCSVRVKNKATGQATLLLSVKI